MAAHNLFYRQGIRATGVDRVALLAKVAPAQLYRLFDSKDDLVAAYTERADARARGRLDAAAKAAGGGPREQILAMFDDLRDQIRPADFRGCACMMTLAEYPDPGSAAHKRAVAAKQWVRDRFGNLCGELAKAGEAQNPEATADDLTLVLEGVLASAQAVGNDGPAARGRALAEKIPDDAALSSTSRGDRASPPLHHFPAGAATRPHRRRGSIPAGLPTAGSVLVLAALKYLLSINYLIDIRV
jgi:AcrR family transcriptional regulator